MGITREIPAGEPFELAGRIVGLQRETGRSSGWSWKAETGRRR